MPDASRTAVRICEEAVIGTVNTNPVFETLLTSAINLTFAPKTKISNTLAADRQVTDNIRVGIDAGGDLPGEAIYGAIDTEVRGAMMSDWIYWPVRDNNGTAALNITAVSATQYTVLTGVAPLTTGKTVNTGTYAPGHLVLGTGFAVAGNNGLKPVTAASATTVTAAGLATEATPPAAALLKVVGIQGAATDISIAGSTIVSVALNFATLGIVAGMWVKVGGTAAGTFFGTPADNDWVRVLLVAAGTLTLDIMPTGWTNDAGTGKTIQLFVGDVIRNGTTKRAFSVEVDYTDLAAEEWDVYTGMHVDQMELSGIAQDILLAKFTYMGLGAANGTARTAGASTIAPSTNASMNTSTSVGEFRINNALVSLGPNFVKDFTLLLANTCRRQPGIGTLGDVGVGLGRAMVTGKISMYYGTGATVRAAILNGTAMSWNGTFYDPNIVVLGASAPAYHVDVPRLKWKDGSPTVPGNDQDRMLVANYIGLKHPVYGYTVQFSRFAYLPT